MRQKLSIKRNTELPVAVHEVRDGQLCGGLSSLFVREERCVGDKNDGEGDWRLP